MTVVAVAVVFYLLVGLAFAAWFLIDCFRAKTRVSNGDGTISDRRVMELFTPRVLARYCLNLLWAWPAAAVKYINAGPDDEEENPEDRVPPEYR